MNACCYDLLFTLIVYNRLPLDAEDGRSESHNNAIAKIGGALAVGLGWMQRDALVTTGGQK